MKKIAITGGSGFIGTNLIDYLSKKNFQIINIDTKSPRNPNQINYWNQLNILNYQELKKKLSEFNPNFICHLAARTDLLGKTLLDYDANINGTRNLVKASKELSSLEKIIFFSSRMVCPIGYQPKSEFDYNPPNKYGESKVLGEKIVREELKKSDCSWIILRPTSIWGPWFDIPYKNFFDLIKSNKYYHPGNKKIEKSFGFIGNSVYQIYSLLKNNDESSNYKTMYLADYCPIDLERMANSIQKEFNSKNIKRAPIIILKLLAIIGDVLKVLGYSNPPLTTFRLNNLLTNMIYESKELRTIANELPYSMEEGISITCKWMIKNK
jgi:nucleoside-diphosphate-sugar epimerase